jgi:hypothetical protein
LLDSQHIGFIAGRWWPPVLAVYHLLSPAKHSQDIRHLCLIDNIASNYLDIPLVAYPKLEIL